MGHRAVCGRAYGGIARMYLKPQSAHQRWRAGVVLDPFEGTARAGAAALPESSAGALAGVPVSPLPGSPRSCQRWCLPRNARRPVSISYSTQPNAQMSVRRSTGWPRVCSGLMLARRAQDDSLARPGHVACRELRDIGAREIPAHHFSESEIENLFTPPLGVIMMFAGFRSRWMMPFSCAASSASATCRPIAIATV